MYTISFVSRGGHLVGKKVKSLGKSVMVSVSSRDNECSHQPDPLNII